MAEYKLLHTAPQGLESPRGPFGTVLDAAEAAMDHLRNERLATRVEAQWFASYLADQPLDVDVTHVHSGHSYRIERTGEGEES